ncbi:hypothetical protein NE237_017421 [Protea cynaroides]|uniref:Uncharacterized protein n=1 Tax=Protea cynaroides TaxID=273540 RepID=A0A9Q0K809_9MAGN|nr:hypothetical protein NE237_017421 [Protea cynaroides]
MGSFSTDGGVQESPVYGVKLSSVVPAGVTRDKKDRKLTSMDLIMKLHYLKGLYFFSKDAVEGLQIMDLKKPMFQLLDLCSAAAGRIRRSDSGRPFIKCNDGGVRIIEAQTNFTLHEWLRINDWSLHSLLVSNQVLGPELGFSPLILLQFTWFRCGGMSLGLRWAHVLGDAFSASRFINLLGHIMAGHAPPKLLNLQEPAPPTSSKSNTGSQSQMLSAKQIEPVGDYWLSINNCKMGLYTFQITASRLTQLQSKISSGSDINPISPFEALSVVIWQSMARIREHKEPRIVTICRNHSNDRETRILSLINNQIFSTVEVDFSVVNAKLSELAALIVQGSVEEVNLIEETVERDQGLSDFIVYGRNLTFVDLEEAEIYGLGIKGHKPVFANYAIDGIGDQGVVIVLPGPENGEEHGSGGRIVTISLPEDQLLQLKGELSKEFCIA